MTEKNLKEAAQSLSQEAKAIEDEIKAEGGIPATDDTGPGGENFPTGTIVDTGLGSQGSGQAPIPDAISGAGPIVSNTDLGTWDIYTPLKSFADMMSAPATGIMDVFTPMLQDMQIFGPKGTTVCPKKSSTDGKVPLCTR
jgi:hypothetical protein